MKKLFRALSLCLTLALCVFGSTAALAEAPAATPAPQDERVVTDVSPLGSDPQHRRLYHQHRRPLRF